MLVVLQTACFIHALCCVLQLFYSHKLMKWRYTNCRKEWKSWELEHLLCTAQRSFFSHIPLHQLLSSWRRRYCCCVCITLSQRIQPMQCSPMLTNAHQCYFFQVNKRVQELVARVACTFLNTVIAMSMCCPSTLPPFFNEVCVLHAFCLFMSCFLSPSIFQCLLSMAVSVTL